MGHEAPLGITTNAVGRLKAFRTLKMLVERPIFDAIVITGSLAREAWLQNHGATKDMSVLHWAVKYQVPCLRFGSLM
jgi:hypothetical protein